MIHLTETVRIPDDAVTQAIGVIGRRGSGKTYAARLVEEFFQ